MARSSRRHNADDDGATDGNVNGRANGDAAVHANGFAPPDASVVDDLRGRLAELQSTVERLVRNSGAAAAPASSGNGVVPGSGPAALDGIDPEIHDATRTLRFARQTADAVVAEARDQAVAIVADAERQRAEIIRSATEAAAGYAAERRAAEAATAAWNAERNHLLDQLEAMAGVLADYRGGLTRIDDTIAAIADQLRQGRMPSAVDGFRPPRSIVIDPDDPFVFDVSELPETTGDFGWETDGAEPSGTAF